MGFLNEQLSALKLDDLSNQDVVCTFIVEKGICVEGYKKIFELSEKKIVLFIENKKSIEIVGENLQIKEIAKNDICISGIVKSLKVI